MLGKIHLAHLDRDKRCYEHERKVRLCQFKRVRLQETVTCVSKEWDTRLHHQHNTTRFVPVSRSTVILGLKPGPTVSPSGHEQCLLAFSTSSEPFHRSISARLYSNYATNASVTVRRSKRARGISTISGCAGDM